MFIKTLTLKNFRNFKKLNMSFSSPVTVFTGNNGVGKTNIIESIHLLANIKSFRNNNDSVLTKWNEKSYYCSAELNDSNFDKISIGFSQENSGSKKKLVIDNNIISKPSLYFGNLLTVVICPSDLNIIETTPEVRRKYFDSVISKTDKEYLDLLNELKKIIHYRNIILKKIKESSKVKVSELDIWDSLLAEKSYFIIKKRDEFLKNYNISFKNFYKKISNESEDPELEYKSKFINLSQSEILTLLQENRTKDIKTGFTNEGPHRDDFKVVLNNDIFINSASQGQKRTAVISLKLSEINLIEILTKKKPIILIDDIFSELDADRRYNMIKALNNGNQLFFTMVTSAIINAIPDELITEYNLSSDSIKGQIEL